MSYDSLLVNSCTIQRYTEGVQDDYGNPDKTWAVLHTDEPCRWSTPKNREIMVGAEVVIAELELFLGDIDITERDRVILDGRTYEVISATQRQGGDNHMECFLRVAK